MFDLVWLTKEGNFACLYRQEWWRFGEAQTGDRDVWRAKVIRPAPALGGAFVSLGTNNALLRYAKDERPLKGGETVLVTIAQPAKGDKLAVVRSRPTLGGKYVVYTPHREGIKFAKGIGDAAIGRWTEALAPLVATLPGGWILRSAAIGAAEQEVTDEMSRLASEWRSLLLSSTVGKVYRAPDVVGQSVAKEAREIWTDDEALVDELARSYPLSLVRYVPDLSQRYRQEERAVQPLLQRVLSIDKGVRLTFDATEAATVVDVDSGAFPLGGDPQSAAREVNRVAAKWLVRLLSLREITGMILVDFVSTDKAGQGDLMNYLADLSTADPRLRVVDMTRLGLVEMTRQGI